MVHRQRSSTLSKGAAGSWHLVWPLVFPALSWHLREPSDPQGVAVQQRGWFMSLLCLGGSQLLCASALLGFPPFLVHSLG